MSIADAPDVQANPDAQIEIIQQAVRDQVIPEAEEYDGLKPFATRTEANLFRQKNQLEGEVVEDGQGGFVLAPPDKPLTSQEKRDESQRIGRLNDAYGKYQGFSPAGQKAIAEYTPFAAWWLSAATFVGKVLPRDHPALQLGLRYVQLARAGSGR